MYFKRKITCDGRKDFEIPPCKRLTITRPQFVKNIATNAQNKLNKVTLSQFSTIFLN